MKTIVIKTRVLCDLLSRGGVFAGQARNLPALDHVLVDIDGNGGMTVLSSRLDHVAMVVGRCDSAGDGEPVRFCVRASEVLRYLKAVADETVTVDVGKVGMTLRHSCGSADYAAVSADDFPEPVAEEVLTSVEMEGAALLRSLAVGAKFVDTTKTRPIMSAVHMYDRQGWAGFFSSDTRCLWCREEPSTTGRDYLMSVPFTAAAALSRIGAGNGTVIVEEGLKTLKFTLSDGSFLICAKVDGKAPNHWAVIPARADVFVECGRAVLEMAARRTLSVNRFMRLTVSERGVTLQSEKPAEGKKSCEILDGAKFDGNITIGLNAEMMLNALSAFNEGTVRLEMTDPRRAAVLTGEDTPDQKILVMPVRLTDE